MTTFKVKDLMIQLPQEGELREQLWCRTTLCVNNTFCGMTKIDVCRKPSIICPAMTDFGGCWGDSRIYPVTKTIYTFTGCGVSTTDPTILETVLDTFQQTDTIKIYVEQGGDLTVLQTQLRKALETVDEGVLAYNEALAPKTVEEIDKLELQLRGALDDLQERRANLK